MKNKKSFIAGMVTMLLLVSLVGTAYATVGTVTRELEYKNISVTLDGKKLDLKDAQGNSVEPFMFGGTNYLPVRALAEALGLSVSWDGKTNTVVLSSNDTSGQTSGASSSNENIISHVDISEGKTPEQEYVDGVNANTEVEAVEKWVEISALNWVEISALNKVASKIGIEKIMSGQSASAQVSDIEILQYCMPSIPNNFMSNPKSGTYDGIQVKVENGKILLNESDLQEKGFI